MSASAPSLSNPPQPGIGANPGQLGLLVLVNAFVGAMVGMERSILPAIAEQEFHFGSARRSWRLLLSSVFRKALTNYFAGRFSDVYGRKVILIAGWPICDTWVPFLLMWAPSWNWILLAKSVLRHQSGANMVNHRDYED